MENGYWCDTLLERGAKGWKWATEEWHENAETWYLGSSHLRHFMGNIPGANITSISGGGVGHGEFAILKKKAEDRLGKIKRVILLLGGNDYGRREKNEIKITMTREELAAWIDHMASWTLSEIPSAEVRTLDIIPRRSMDGEFVNGIVRLHLDVVRVHPTRHRHISMWRMFAAGTNNLPLATEQLHFLGNEEHEGRPREGNSVVKLRDELFTPDGVHLNNFGQQALLEVLKWQNQEAPNETTTVTVQRISRVRFADFKFEASFKF